MRLPNYRLHSHVYISKNNLALSKTVPNFLLKRKDSNLQRHTAAVSPRNLPLLSAYIYCKHFYFIRRVYHFTTLQCFSKNFFLRRRKDSNFHGLIHGQFITPDRSTLLCLPLHHDLHVFEHMVGFEPTMPFRIRFCRPMVSTTRPHVHVID